MAWLLVLGLIGLVVALWRLEVVCSQLGNISFQLGKLLPSNDDRLPKGIRELSFEIGRATEQLNLIQSNTSGLSAEIRNVERAILDGNRRARSGA
jgi:hypothetical protein